MKVALALLALIFQVTTPVPQTPQAPSAQPSLAPNIIEDVRISGNRRMSAETIKYNLQTKKGAELNSAIIARDVKALYALGYFDDIAVPDPETGPRGGKIVTFTVKEKPFIRKIDYKGAKSITNSDILDKFREKKVGLSVETPYDPTKTKKAEIVIKEMLAEKGHQNATVGEETEDVPPSGMNLTFVIMKDQKSKSRRSPSSVIRFSRTRRSNMR
jgi:outer membrane protein insertion porin family